MIDKRYPTQKPGGKITPAARERMARHTAQQQLNDTLLELMTPPDDVPDADDSSATRDEVMR